VTARDRLLGARRDLVAALVMRAMLAGVAVGLVGAAVAHALGWSSSLATALALLVSAAMLRRVRPARDLERVALWVEERHPALRYAVVTVADRRQPAGGAIEAQALAFPWWKDARRAAARVVIAPAVAVMAATLLLLAAPVLPRHGVGTPNATAITPRRAAADVDVLAHLRATVVPPAYSRRPAVTVDDPTSLEALAGSVVTVSGEGDATRVGAAVDSSPRAVGSRGDRWTIAMPMPARPALLHVRALGAAGRERLIVLAPTADAPPAVTLLLPARDTVLRTATGVWPLRAQLRDDIGLRDAQFELVISSGQDESFTFRSTTIGRVQLGNATGKTLEARLSLDSLALKPGDVLQLRAVARDGNDVTGPGVGSSETRSLRLARAGEYDSVAVDPAPPGEPEGQVLSQRMLITLAEALEKRRARLARNVMLDESRRIAADQTKLRKRVGDVVFQRMGGEPLSEESSGETIAGKLTPEELLKRAEEATHADVGAVMDVEGDETPILALNKPLLEAFNAMWDAGRSLEQGEPGRALPAMRRALAAIERARQAERIYLRGRPSNVVVDLARARLTGKDRGTASVREPRVAVDPMTRRRVRRFANATELVARDPAAAADTLLVMRVEALEDAPALAGALDEAVRALRTGDTGAVSLAWLRVRRALAPAPERSSLGLWGGGGAP
jgi:hypothetical protein